MPSIKWSEIDHILHRTKGTLTKIVGIEKHCQRYLEVSGRCPKACSESKCISKELLNEGNEILKYCKTVRCEAVAEIEAINELILSQMENDE